MKIVVASIFILVLPWELAFSQIESSLPLRIPFALAEGATLEVSPTNHKGIPDLPYVIVASTGPESFSGLSKYPVLNNDDVVAFVGTIQGADEITSQNVYGWTHEAEPTQPPRPMFVDTEEFLLPILEDNTTPSQGFDSQVSLNEEGAILAHRTLKSTIFVGTFDPFPMGSNLEAQLTYYETWNARESRQSHADQTAMGHGGAPAGTTWFLAPVWAGPNLEEPQDPDRTDIPSPFNGFVAEVESFSVVFPGGRHNSNGQAVFSALLNGENVLVCSEGETYSTVPTGGPLSHAPLAEDGTILIRNGDSADAPIEVYPWGLDLTQTRTVASTENYSTTGDFPGISEDGNVVAFIATDRESGETGIYLAADFERDGFDTTLRLASTDLDVYDVPSFSEIPLDRRVLTALTPTGEHTAVYTVSFTATDAGEQQGIYEITVDFASSEATIISTRRIVRAGDTLPGLDDTLAEISIGEGVNSSGDAVFWTTTSEGTEAIVYAPGIPDATPPLLATDSEIVQAIDQDHVLATVKLDGSASTDPDGTIVEFQWAGRGETPSPDATDSAIAEIDLEPGTHEFLLTIIDNDGFITSDTLMVTVKQPSLEVLRSLILQNFADTDTNGDSTLDLTEAQGLVTYLLEREFESLDRDSSNALSEIELASPKTVGCALGLSAGTGPNWADGLLVMVTLLALLWSAFVVRNSDGATNQSGKI